MITHKQLSLPDIFSDCQNFFEEDKPKFLSLLEEHIDLDEIVPASFYHHFYLSTGRTRKYSLTSLLWALIVQKVFSIPTDSLLLTFLHYSKDLRDFCGFTKVPDASKITRFKQDFAYDLQVVFERLVDVTKPICRKIDAAKAEMTIFDSSGIEAYVQENNPKYTNRIIRQMKAYSKTEKANEKFNPYQAAYAAMPSSANTNKEIKQLYINGHFCYVYKFGMVTNGLGIVRHISLYNKDFYREHPEIKIEKKTDSPDEDKSVHDSRLLIPTLKDYFDKHPSINAKTFIGDSAFDAVNLYKDLLTGNTFGKNKHFSKAYIPLNHRAMLKTEDYSINENGIPGALTFLRSTNQKRKALPMRLFQSHLKQHCCPKDDTLPMKPEGNTSHLRCKLPTFKFVCPKMKWVTCSDGKQRRRTFCENPCTSSKCGRMIYVYPEKNLRAYPGTIRGTDDLDKTYKIRTSVERTINHFKENFCLADRKTQNERTLHADLLLSGITQLITVLLADKIHKHQYIRSLKPIIA